MLKAMRRALLVVASAGILMTAMLIAVPTIVLRPALAHWQAGGFPSLSVAVGNGCGVLWSSAAGVADLGSGRPARTTDLYGVGSITKTFVAVVALQLVDEGRLNLERPATDYVPRLREMHIANAGTATLAQLMNHTSGIPSWEDDRLPRRYHFDTEVFRTTAGIAPSFTVVRPGLLDVSSASLAPEWAAGGLVTTARDLASFALALRDGRLLNPKQLAFMQTWRPAESGSEVGHGLFRFDRGNDRHTIGHQGAVLGFGAQMEWLESGDAVIVSLSNVGSIDGGDAPLDRHAALPFVLATIAYTAAAKATGCLGHSSTPSARNPVR
jgi:CubicO group peptidase (beta-lactamase class C family)